MGNLPAYSRTLSNCLNIGSQRANKRGENDLESKSIPLTLRRRSCGPRVLSTDER
jgi:hypothetical protein